MVPNERLSTPPTPPRRFAYCSDTAYSEKIVELIRGVNCLYHETTFLSEDMVRAKQTLHSTAAQAAQIAQAAEVGKLIIGHYSARYRQITPFLEEAKAIFPNTVGATDGAQFDI